MSAVRYRAVDYSTGQRFDDRDEVGGRNIALPWFRRKWIDHEQRAIRLVGVARILAGHPRQRLMDEAHRVVAEGSTIDRRKRIIVAAGEDLLPVRVWQFDNGPVRFGFRPYIWAICVMMSGAIECARSQPGWEGAACHRIATGVR